MIFLDKHLLRIKVLFFSSIAITQQHYKTLYHIWENMSRIKEHIAILKHKRISWNSFSILCSILDLHFYVSSCSLNDIRLIFFMILTINLVNFNIIKYFESTGATRLCKSTLKYFRKSSKYPALLTLSEYHHIRNVVHNVRF